MNTILTIAKLTFREAVRRKIVLAGLVLGVAFLLFYDVALHFIVQEINHEAAIGGRTRDFYRSEAMNFFFLAGLYVVNFLCVAIGALISSDSLAGEIQSGTIQAVVTKPIRRMGVVTGKWLGYASLLLLYLLMLGGGMLISVRLIGSFQPTNWLPGLALIYFNSLIILSLTLALSSSMSTLATGGAVFGAYGLAFIGGWVERIGSAIENQTAVDMGIFSSLLLPTEAIWNKAAGVMTSPAMNMVGMNPFTSSSQPSTIMIFYAGLYMLAAVGVAIWRFSRRDL